MTKRVMVIDDEPDIRLYLLAAIEDAGFEPVTYGGGSIVEEMDAMRPDLVLLDILMPGQSGLSLYRELRTSERHRAVPVVIVSGMTSEADFRKEGFRRLVPDEAIPPPEGFLEKPIAVPALNRVLRDILGAETGAET